MNEGSQRNLTINGKTFDNETFREKYQDEVEAERNKYLVEFYQDKEKEDGIQAIEKNSTKKKIE